MKKSKKYTGQKVPTKTTESIKKEVSKPMPSTKKVEQAWQPRKK